MPHEPKTFVEAFVNAVANGVSATLRLPVWQRFNELEEAIRLLADKARVGEEVTLNFERDLHIDADELAKSIAFALRDPYPTRVKSVTFHVKRDDVLIFEGGTEPIEVHRLLRIIGNATAAAERVKTYVDQQHRGVRDAAEIKDRVSRAAATRYAATLYVNFDTLLELIGGKDFERRTPDWRMAQEEDDNEDEEKPDG